MLSVVNAVAVGTTSVYIFWEPLEQELLRGFIENQTFRIITNYTKFNDQTRDSSISVEGLISSSDYIVEVLVSNGVLYSPSAARNVRTFDRPPSPQLMEGTLTNTSFTAILFLDSQTIDLLTELSIRIEITEVSTGFAESESQTTIVGGMGLRLHVIHMHTHTHTHTHTHITHI